MPVVGRRTSRHGLRLVEMTDIVIPPAHLAGCEKPARRPGEAFNL